MLLRLIRLQLGLAFRRKSDLLAVIMFLLAVAFTIYMGFQRMRPETWAILFWITMLFVGASSVVTSLRIFGGREKYFYFQIASPENLFLSRILYETVFLMVYALLLLLVFSAFFGEVLPFSGPLLITILLGSLSLSIVYTFVAALVGAAGKGSTFASLLGFPMLIPVVLLLVRLYYQHMGFIDDETIVTNWLSLIGIDAVLLGAGIVLFPLIWRS